MCEGCALVDSSAPPPPPQKSGDFFQLVSLSFSQNFPAVESFKHLHFFSGKINVNDLLKMKEFSCTSMYYYLVTYFFSWRCQRVVRGFLLTFFWGGWGGEGKV